MANGRTGRTAAKNSLFTSGEEIAERKRKERASFGSKVDEANAKRKAEREAKAAKRKEQMEESTARLSERKKAARLKAQKNRNPRGKGSSKAAAATAAPAAPAASKGSKESTSSKAQPKFGVGKEFTIRGGKANVTADQLKKTGLTQAQYMKQWRATNKRPTAATAKKAASASSASSAKKPATKKVGLLRRVLLGKDGKFGGARGAIDFLPGKSRPKKKAMGGMMKSKGMAKGGAMKKKGYSMGGAVSKKATKPRGVGAATRGYGRAMK